MIPLYPYALDLRTDLVHDVVADEWQGPVGWSACRRRTACGLVSAGMFLSPSPLSTLTSQTNRRPFNGIECPRCARRAR